MPETQPRLTIAIFHDDDFLSLQRSIALLHTMHAEAMRLCEIVVFDRNPDSQAGKKARKLAESWNMKGNCGARWIPIRSLWKIDPVSFSLNKSECSAIIICNNSAQFGPGSLDRFINSHNNYSAARKSFDEASSEVLGQGASTVAIRNPWEVIHSIQ